jgi:hypothetical protein
MRQVKGPQRDWTLIDEACLMSCRHRADVELAEYDMWLATKNHRDAQEVKMLIGIMLVPFVLLAIMCAWSLHTGDWSWLD